MKVVRIDGGMGRVICAVPAIEKLAKTDEVVVQTPYDWVFNNNPHIKEVFLYDDSSIWEKVIKNNEFLSPEPYHNHLYYKQKHHLIQSFDYLINGEEEMSKPNLYLSTEENEKSKSQIEKYKKEHGVDKVIVLQPFGSSADSNRRYWDISGRSLPFKFIETISEMDVENIRILPMGFSPNRLEQNSDVFISEGPRQIDEWLGLIKHSDYFVGCDSVGQHIARAFDVPGTVFLGTTFRENISYEEHFDIIQESNFPIEYNPLRIFEKEASTTQPFLYTKREQESILTNLFKKVVML